MQHFFTEEFDNESNHLSHGGTSVKYRLTFRRAKSGVGWCHTIQYTAKKSYGKGKSDEPITQTEKYENWLMNQPLSWCIFLRGAVCWPYKFCVELRSREEELYKCESSGVVAQFVSGSHVTSSMDKFLGKWEVTGTENMDTMLRAFGESKYTLPGFLE